jgi:hypothetical protein
MSSASLVTQPLSTNEQPFTRDSATEYIHLIQYEQHMCPALKPEAHQELPGGHLRTIAWGPGYSKPSCQCQRNKICNAAIANYSAFINCPVLKFSTCEVPHNSSAVSLRHSVANHLWTAAENSSAVLVRHLST